MPVDITAANQPERTYHLRDTHADTGELLWAWDTLSPVWGLCEHEGIAQQVINGSERLVCLIEGPPATVFTLGVSSLAFNARTPPPSVQPGTIDIQLVAGHGRASTLLTHVQWTPNTYDSSGDQHWIFQETRRLCSSWWLFMTVLPPPAGAVQEAKIAFRVMLSRGSPVALATPQVGPNVVVIP